MAEDFVSPRRLRYAFETRSPPAPRAAAMDTQASKRRGRGSAGGTSVGVASGAQWGCGKRDLGAGRRGAFRDLGIAQRWAARASAVARVRCVVRSWPPLRVDRGLRIDLCLFRYMSRKYPWSVTQERK